MKVAIQEFNKNLISSFGVASILLLSACNPLGSGQDQSSFDDGHLSEVSAIANRGVLDPSVAWLGAGNYTDVDLTKIPAAKICSDKNIFGVTGTAVCADAPTALDVTLDFTAGNYNSVSNAPVANTYLPSVTLFGAVGTMSIGANITGADGLKVITIPQGYYDGTKTATATDADLVTGNIKAGVTLFGVAGASSVVDTVLGDAVSAEILSSKKAYVNGSLVTGAMTNHGAMDAGATFPGAGYYSATINNLPIASNIISGNTILGVAGSATAAYSACSDNTLNVALCSSAANRYVATSAGANVTGANATLSASIPQGFYDGTQSCTMSDTNLIAGNISSGVSIFGTAGTLTFGDFTASTQARDTATTQVSLKAEAVTNAGIDYTNSNPGYRAIPVISKDDEITNITYVSRTGWTNTCDTVTGANGGSANSACTCGLSGSIVQRIADCAAHGKIGANATWNGATKGNAGQGIWKLVTRTGNVTASNGREVWQDQRTMLLWSSRVSSSLNWCKATGSNNIAGNPVAENDVSNLCNNVTYQNVAGQAVSACFEDDGTYFTQTDANIDPAGKGGLGRSSTPAVSWRIPTKWDYQQADVDGLVAVLPDGPGGGFEWAGTVISWNRAYAFMYRTDFPNGQRQTSQKVRCVGR